MKSPVLSLAVNWFGGKQHGSEGSKGTLGSASVVIPCYRYGGYLSAAVFAALDQPRLEMEVVIVDDCSPDNSGEIADALAANDSRVRVIHHRQNMGHIATYNDGLDAAQGEFVALVSADDLLTPGSISRSVALMSTHHSVGFVYGRALHFSGRPPSPKLRPEHWIIWPGDKWLEKRFHNGYNVIASPEVVMRTEVLRRVGGYRSDLPHSGDLEMWLRAATVSDVGYIAGPIQALYRNHPANMHKEVFLSGQEAGRLLDLKERWAAFDTVILTQEGHLRNPEQKGEMVRKTLANEALSAVVHSRVRRSELDARADLISFAQSIYPSYCDLLTWRTLNRLESPNSKAYRYDPVVLSLLLRDRVLDSMRWWRLKRAGF